MKKLNTTIGRWSLLFASIGVLLISAIAAAIPTPNCRPPISCPGGSANWNGTNCYCSGLPGTKSTSVTTHGPVNGNYCTKSTGFCGTDCNRIQIWSMNVRNIECNIDEDTNCILGTCEDGVISKTNTNDHCGCEPD